jgi:hypothetical protein
MAAHASTLTTLLAETPVCAGPLSTLTCNLRLRLDRRYPNLTLLDNSKVVASGLLHLHSHCQDGNCKAEAPKNFQIDLQ